MLRLGAGGARGQPHHRDHRQPERQGCAKGGSTLDPSGYDAGKKVFGRKGHILTGTFGLLLAVVVHPANVRDRDGSEELLREARRSFPFIERLIGDASYQGRRWPPPEPAPGPWRSSAAAIATVSCGCQSDRSLRAPWWISRCRCLARDYERRACKAAAFVRLVMICLMLTLAASPSA